MKNLVVSLLLSFALLSPAAGLTVAADQNQKPVPVSQAPKAAPVNPSRPRAVPVKAAPAAPAPSPFFVGAHVGMGWTNQQYNFITIPGQVTGNFYPTGGIVGLTAGVGGMFGGIYGEFYIDADYVFARGSAAGVDPNTGNSFLATSRNAVELQQGVFIGAPVSAITGVIPQQTVLPASSSWPIPVMVPTNLSMANLVIGPEGGIAERQVSGCLSEAGVSSCADRWVYGPFAGIQVQYAVTPQWKLRIKYDHTFYNASWTQPGGVGVLGAFKVLNTDAGKVALTYNF